MEIKTYKETVSSCVLQNTVLKKHLVAVYLFGSALTGKKGERSDIDLAFVLDEGFYRGDPFAALQEVELLSVDIAEKSATPVDTVILNSASLSFAYHTVRRGVCIYESNTTDRILFEVALDNKYQDFAPFLEELRASKSRALHGRD
jgi:predicted nucleotidyltransferase